MFSKPSNLKPDTDVTSTNFKKSPLSSSLFKLLCYNAKIYTYLNAKRALTFINTHKFAIHNLALSFFRPLQNSLRPLHATARMWVALPNVCDCNKLVTSNCNHLNRDHPHTIQLPKLKRLLGFLSNSRCFYPYDHETEYDSIVFCFLSSPEVRRTIFCIHRTCAKTTVLLLQFFIKTSSITSGLEKAKSCVVNNAE